MKTLQNSDELLARCTFPEPGQPAMCAVSGGADSIAMTLLALTHGCDVSIIHVDHGLRSASAEDAEFVLQFARDIGVACEVIRVDVPTGPNQEARARAMRHSVLPEHGLLAHTADDQAETVLLNTMRGAGLRGIGGMAQYRHPILGLRRSETEAVCAEAGIDYRIDLTNFDSRFRRNRVRHEVIPLLNDVADRDTVETLSRAARVFREDDLLLDQLASELDPTDCRAMQQAPIALVRRALRMWLTPMLVDEVGETHPPSLAGLDRVIDVVYHRTEGTELPGGLRVRRSQGKLFTQEPHSTTSSA